MDLERFTIEPSYRVNRWLRFESEIEFEHGGTGVTLEFDPFEEFGEIEIEKLQAEFLLRRGFNGRVGRLYVPVGRLSSHDEPDEYFTISRATRPRSR